MNDKGEIAITGLEVELMGVLIRHKVFSDRRCAEILVTLAEKLL